MDLLWDGLTEAFRLIFTFDGEVFAIASLSLAVSGFATLLSLAIGVPVGSFLALRHFPGRPVVLAIVNTGMGLPPVVVGLFVAVMLWRSGPLGDLHLIYTPMAMVIAQCVIATPIITGFTAAALQSLDPRLRLQILSLGASTPQMLWLLLKEARLPLLAAVMAGFGAVISEVGASLMVGGNIKDETRVLTTAMVLETSRGQFELALALGIILLVLMIVVNAVLTAVQQGRRVV
ncbi:MAG: ABC transporter permease [Dehalococcoidia bacterium]